MKTRIPKPKILLLIICICSPLALMGQGRAIFNSSFEVPDLSLANTCATHRWKIDCQRNHMAFFLSTEVDFWETTASDTLIEFGINGGAHGLTTPYGNQFVELNANQVSNLYFDVCMFAGESISWSLAHRRRITTGSNRDAMALVITEPNGNNRAAIALQTNANNNWRTHSGNYTNNTGQNGSVRFSFQATGSASGDLTVGNIIDNVVIEGLAALVEFDQEAYADSERVAAANPPQIRVNGIVPTGGARVFLNVSGGTATSGVDYTLPVSVTIPAGNYLNQRFNIPFTVADDGIPEGDETIIYEMVSTQLVSPGTGRVAPMIRNTACGPAPNNETTYTLMDIDEPLSSGSIQLYAQANCDGVHLQGNLVNGASTAWVEYRGTQGAWHRVGTLESTSFHFQHTNTDPLAYYRIAQPDGHRSAVQAIYNSCAARQQFSAYFEAASKQVQLDYFAPKGTSHIRLVDVTGRTCFIMQDSQENPAHVQKMLDVAHLSAGAYIVQVTHAEGNFTRKILLHP